MALNTKAPLSIQEQVWETMDDTALKLVDDLCYLLQKYELSAIEKNSVKKTVRNRMKLCWSEVVAKMVERCRYG